MATLFTKIINGTIPSYKIAETPDYYAFLDINPNTKGHTLCVPKKEVDNLFDLEEDVYLGLLSFSKKIAKAMQNVLTCERVAMSVIGLEVPHAHVHLIAIDQISDVSFATKVKLTPEEFESIAQQIRLELKDIL